MDLYFHLLFVHFIYSFKQYLLKLYYASGTFREIGEELNKKIQWSVKSIRMEDMWGNIGAQRSSREYIRGNNV